MKSNGKLIYPSPINNKNMDRYLHKKLAEAAEGGGGSSDSIKYTEQELTSEQQAQARTNIGAGTYTKPQAGIPASDLATGVIPADKVFIATHNVTSYNELWEAHQQDKVLLCKFIDEETLNTVYAIGNLSEGASEYDGTVSFGCIVGGGVIALATCTYDGEDFYWDVTNEHYIEDASEEIVQNNNFNITLPIAKVVCSTLYEESTYTISLAQHTGDHVAHYFWHFEVEDTSVPPTIIWPAINWAGNEAPTIEGGKVYEVSILKSYYNDYYGTCVEFPNPNV